MKKRIVQQLSLVLVCAVLIGTVLGGCKSTEDMIVGRWEVADAVGITSNSYGVTYLKSLEFFSDGTYASNNINYAGSYSIDNDRLRLSGILMPTLVYSFEIKGETLRLYTDSDSYIEYKRLD